MKRRRVKILPQHPVLAEATRPTDYAALAGPPPKGVTAHDVATDAPCRVCGGGVPPGGLHWGEWRIHADCQNLQGSPANRLLACCRALARLIEPTDALLQPFDPLPYVDVHPSPVWSTEPTRDRLPWRHIDRAALDEALGELGQLRIDAGLADGTCELGPCAWCGVRVGRGWTVADPPHAWPDNSPAALCGSCITIYVRTGSPDPRDWDAQRAGIAEAVCSVPTMMGETPPAIPAFAEGDASSDGSPWGHLDAEALDAYRWSRWTRFASYAPPERQSEALERARAEQAAKAAQQAATEAHEAAKLDVFGFTRVS